MRAHSARNTLALTSEGVRRECFVDAWSKQGQFGVSGKYWENMLLEAMTFGRHKVRATLEMTTYRSSIVWRRRVHCVRVHFLSLSWLRLVSNRRAIEALPRATHELPISYRTGFLRKSDGYVRNAHRFHGQ